MTDTMAAPRRPHPFVSAVLALLVTALDAALLAIALAGMAPLLAHPRALTLLAVWAIAAVTLAVMRPARGPAAATVERESPLVLPALFLIPLVTAPLAAFCERLALWQLPGGVALRWSGVALAAVGLTVRIVAMAQLGRRFSPLVALQHEHALETHGLYARIRHPGYLGAWLAALGGALAFGGGLSLPLVVVMGLLLWTRAGREEAMLERRFGEDYRRYRERSGRFLPPLAPPRA
jgi:protein-S-isoprenylcysteine O-methyltransferase Ste14